MPKAIAVDSQTHHLGKVFQTYFLPSGGPANVEEYKPSDKFMMAVSIGKSTGTGQMMGMKVFSFLIWYAKCRFLGTDYYADVVAGLRTLSGNLKG